MGKLEGSGVASPASNQSSLLLLLLLVYALRLLDLVGRRNFADEKDKVMLWEVYDLLYVSKLYHLSPITLVLHNVVAIIYLVKLIELGGKQK